MRDGRYVGNHRNFQIAGAERTNRRFSAGARSLYIHFHASQAVFFRRFRRRFAGLLGCERGALSGTLEAEAARARPGYSVAVHISNRNQGVIERGLNVNLTFVNFFKFFTSSGCCCFFFFFYNFCPPSIISFSSRRYDGDLSSFSRCVWNSDLLRAILFCGGFRDSSRFPSIS